MKNLLLSNLLGFILLGCSSKIHSNYKPLDNSAKLTPIFSEPTSHLYKAKVDILKYYLSGLLFIKPISEDTFRLIFTNELGIKFFDIELFPNGKKVHYILDKMDKKPVINTLEKDMKLFLMNDFDLDQAKKFESDAGSTVFKFSDSKESYYYFQNTMDQIGRVELTSRKKIKVEATLEDYKEGIPHLIRIKHNNFKFNIELNYLQR
jgi:hypothetical protein